MFGVCLNCPRSVPSSFPGRRYEETGFQTRFEKGVLGDIRVGKLEEKTQIALGQSSPPAVSASDPVMNDLPPKDQTQVELTTLLPRNQCCVSWIDDYCDMCWRGE